MHDPVELDLSETHKNRLEWINLGQIKDDHHDYDNHNAVGSIGIAPTTQNHINYDKHEDKVSLDHGINCSNESSHCRVILGLGLLLLRLVFLLLLWFLDVFLNLEINVLVLDLIVWVHLLRVLIVVNVDIIGWLMHVRLLVRVWHLIGSGGLAARGRLFVFRRRGCFFCRSFYRLL